MHLLLFQVLWPLGRRSCCPVKHCVLYQNLKQRDVLLRIYGHLYEYDLVMLFSYHIVPTAWAELQSTLGSGWETQGLPSLMSHNAAQ